MGHLRAVPASAQALASILPPPCGEGSGVGVAAWFALVIGHHITSRATGIILCNGSSLATNTVARARDAWASQE